MFKIYFNKKTKHPALSIKQKDKKHWFNMSFSHTKSKNDSCLVIHDPHPNAIKGSVVYARRYIRKDKKGVKGFKYKKYRLDKESESLIKQYLHQKYKKKMMSS